MLNPLVAGGQKKGCYPWGVCVSECPGTSVPRLLPDPSRAVGSTVPGEWQDVSLLLPELPEGQTGTSSLFPTPAPLPQVHVTLFCGFKEWLGATVTRQKRKHI